MASWRHRVLSQPIAAFDAYERGEVDLEHVYSAITTASGVLESPDRELADTLLEAAGALEVLRFTVDRSDERAAASRILTPIRARIEAAFL